MKFVSVFLILFLTFIPDYCLSGTTRHGFPDTLYPPEEIIAFSDKLQLTEGQKEKIDSLTAQHEDESVYLSNKLKILSDRFAEVIGETTVNRTEASLVLDEINSVEKVQKERTMLFLIDLKNLLTVEQQKILSDHKE